MAPVDNNDDVETGDEAEAQPRKKLKIKLVPKKKKKAQPIIKMILRPMKKTKGWKTTGTACSSI